MENRILELELWSQIGTSWVNGPVVAKMAPGRFKQNPQAKEAADASVNRFYRRLNDEFADKDFVACDRFTVADITLLTAIDFATALVGLEPPGELSHLWEWHQRVSARPSAAA